MDSARFCAVTMISPSVCSLDAVAGGATCALTVAGVAAINTIPNTIGPSFAADHALSVRRRVTLLFFRSERLLDICISPPFDVAMQALVLLPDRPSARQVRVLYALIPSATKTNQRDAAGHRCVVKLGHRD
jgi:hypothetical protein